MNERDFEITKINGASLGLHMPEDSLLPDLQKAKRGDRLALDRVLGHLEARFRRLAQGRIGPGLKAKMRTSDILQSTYLDVVKSVENFEGKDAEEFVAWVARIMENNIRDKDKYFQARKRKDPKHVRISTSESSEMPLNRSTPSVEAVRAEDLLLVSQALDKLDPDYKTVILMRMVEGKSHKEIADVLGRSDAATRMLLSRARTMLSLELDRLRGRP